MTMRESDGTTLRLIMPQWQGGDLADYHFGTEVLAWLAPSTSGPVEVVPVPEPAPGETLAVEDGIVARAAVLAQARAAREAIERHRPDRIVTLGGDCLVDLAPMAYLSARYGSELGVLWVDAHTDARTPGHTPRAHAHVLGALLGQGDPGLVAEAGAPLTASRVMLAGLDELRPDEVEVMARLGLRKAGSADLAGSSAPILDWIRDQRIEQLAIHLDLDVLDPKAFGPQVVNMPEAPPNFRAGVPRGRMTPPQVVRLLADVAKACKVVGLAVTEYVPWEAIETRKLLRQLPLLGNPMAC
jgi:arginase